MASFSLRTLGAASAVLALAACAETVPAGSAPTAATGTPVTAPAVAAAPVVVAPPGTVVVPPAAVATPPVAAAPVYPAAPVVVPYSGTTMSPAVVPARLTAPEISALVANNTVEGVGSNGRPYHVYFVRDGRLKFRQDDYVDGGSWRVTTDGRLCSTMTRINVGVEECYSIYRNGANFRFDRPDGNQVGTFAVLPGNPQNL
jgi:hypothetical protein